MFGWFLVVRKGDSGKAEMPSGRLVLATRHVDLKAASTRLPGWHDHYEAWEKQDQMSST